VTIRDNNISSEIIGILIFPYELLTFAIGALYTGIVRALFASPMRTVFPDDYVLQYLIILLPMLSVGDFGSLTGTVFRCNVLDSDTHFSGQFFLLSESNVRS
jgi:ABC-type branched-subunit amino acid transport system permease subunit